MTTFRIHSPRLLILAVMFGTATACAQVASLPATMSFRSIDSVAIPFQNGIPVPSFEPQHRPTIDLGGIWRKLRFSPDHNITLGKRDSAGYAALVTEAGGMFLPSFVDTAWQTKTLPGVENTLNGYEKTPEYYENGVWYRRAFSVHDSLKGRAAILKFLAVNYVADVWLNGTYLGWHEGGYTPFAFDVSSVIRIDTVNVLAVRVDNPPWNPGQSAGGNYRIDIVPYYMVDWFNYTGIIHDVLLEFPDSIFVPRVDIVPLDTLGSLKVGISVWNRATVNQNVDISVQVAEAAIDSTNIDTQYSADLFGSAATLSGTAQTLLAVSVDSCRAWKTMLTVLAPKLWSPKHPNLYIMKVTLSQSGHVLDEFNTQFGIRTVRTSGSRLLLNGQVVFLPGVARHEDHPGYGRSLPRDVIASDLKKLKTLNVAFLRTAHYPNHPYTYMMADRLGFTVLEEIPVWWFDTDLAWSIQNTTRHIHTQMFREMVFRDYNRPSIIFWSTCNECMAITGRLQFISNVKTELNSQYPDGRLVTESAAADRPGPTDPTQSACDVAGWTMYFGIFHGSTYFDGTLVFIRSAHTAFPNKPIIDTEFGYWSNVTGSATAKQVVVLDSTFMAFAEYASVGPTGAINPFGCLAATTWWTAFDWFTCQQSTSYQTMGLYHMDRTTAKPVADSLAATYLPYYTTLMTTGVEDRQLAALPAAFRLDQNYPNPFNPTTVVSYQVPVASSVRLAVYDILGREVAVLVHERKAAGSYSVEFNAAGLASGVYFYRIQAGTFAQTRKLLLLR
jgi:beta-galactosidase